MKIEADGDYRFAPDERPLFPGGPFAPKHSRARKAGYVGVAFLIGICSALGNALVTVNVSSLAGPLGVYAADASWLPAIYVAMSASANLMLIKARVEFGIQNVTRALLIGYALIASLQLLVPTFAAAVAVRAAAGFAAAGLTALTIFYLIQVVPAIKRPAMIAIAIVIPQLASPLARMVPVELLTIDAWRGLHLLELALPLACLAATSWLPLPPSERSCAFEKLDAVTIALAVPGMILLCGVLGVGRFLWWTDTPWLGWALAGAVTLLAAAIAIELNRSKPLLQIPWLTSLDILRFAMVALLVRLALAEQTYGAVGLLTASGLTNDQLHVLFFGVLLAMGVGVTVAVKTLAPQRIPYQGMFAALAIALGAWLDAHSNNLSRPEQLYLSQALIGFGTALFLGPALLYGFLRVLQLGPAFLISFIVLFNLTQNVGGLAGSALLGSLQIAATRAHAVALSEHLVAADPQVAARLAAQGAGALNQSLQREASVLAYNDVFSFVALLAFGTALFLGYRIIVLNRRQRLQALAKGAPA